MKSMFKILLGVAISAMLAAASITAFAYTDKDFSDLPLIKSDGISTIVTDKAGVTHTFSGIIDAENLEKSKNAELISGYEVKKGSITLLSVTLTDIISEKDAQLSSEEGKPATNGYYSVDFAVSQQDNTEAYLTGLTPENVALVQTEILKSFAMGKDFSFEHIDFIDTEKTAKPSDGDNELCWAAQMSNIMHYTGWAQKAGYQTTDDLFDFLVSNFTDFGGQSSYGMEWFFNGNYAPHAWEEWSKPSDYGNSGKFLPDYDAEEIVNYIDMEKKPENINVAFDSLKAGCGVGMSVSWLDNGVRMGGHAITLWGYIIDNDYSIYDKQYYVASVMTDSDSDQVSEGDRRTSPNKLYIAYMTPYEDSNYDTWIFNQYGTGVLAGYTALTPYSDEIEYETDESATRSKFDNVDFRPGETVLTEVGAHADREVVLNKNREYHISYKIFNYTDKDFSGHMNNRITVKNRTTGETVYTDSYTTIDFDDSSYNAVTYTYGSMPALDPGKYTITVELNYDKAIPEAFYYNNTSSQDFTVSDVEYDLANVKLQANIGEFEDGFAKVTFDYPGLSDVEQVKNNNFKYYVGVSYYIDGEWSSYSSVEADETSENGAYVPMSCGNIGAYGQKVRFLLSADDMNSVLPCLEIYSDEYDLDFFKVSAFEAENNTGVYSNLERGATQLAPGEVFSFCVQNTSTNSSKALNAKVELLAISTKGSVTLYSKDNITLAHGETSEDITVNSWTEELSGTYSVYAVVTTDYSTESAFLGEIRVKEKHGFAVNTNKDVENEYDDLVSLREAVKYIKEFGGENDIITADLDNYIVMKAPIVIDFPVTIDGINNSSTENHAQGMMLYADSVTKFFIVTEDGELNAKNMTIRDAYSATNGGAIENHGGKVNLDTVMMHLNVSAENGGSIYSDGGSVVLKNCAFRGCGSNLGGAVYITGNAKADILNCTIIRSESENSTLYNDNGTMNVLYTSITDSTNNAVGGNGKTNLIGCILVKNGKVTTDANVNLYGCYADDIGTAISDELTVNGTEDAMFLVINNHTYFENFEDIYASKCYLYTSEEANKGIYVRNDNGKVAYSADNESFVTTDADAFFEDADYQTDALGNHHDNLYGAVIPMTENHWVENDDKTVAAFVKAETKAVIIEALYDADGKLSDVKLTNTLLNSGTTVLEYTFEKTEGQYEAFYIWNGLDTLKPIFGELEVG